VTAARHAVEAARPSGSGPAMSAPPAPMLAPAQTLVPASTHVAASALPPAASGEPSVRAGVRSIALLAGLAIAVAARFVATQAAIADGVTIGLGFGVALLAAAVVLGGDARGLVETRLRIPRAVAIGLGGGAALVALALVGRMLGGQPAVASIPGSGALTGAFGPWALATVVVATAEEAILRGALLRRLSDVSGPWLAIAITSLVFGLMHVPFYGWHVVPLDVGVGIWLAGLRLESGGIVAPSIAHAVADLATWWM